MTINEKGLSAACAAFNSCQSIGDIGYPIAMRMQSAIAEYLAAIEEAGFVVVNEGKLWSILKSGLTMGHTDMRKIVEADKFETAAAHEDELARKLTDRVFAMLAAKDAT